MWTHSPSEILRVAELMQGSGPAPADTLRKNRQEMELSDMDSKNLC